MGDDLSPDEEAKVKKKKRRLIEVDEKTLELIKDRLPSQPWPKGTHKQIAEQLGVKNKVVSSAIQLLIKKGVFKPQINGVIEE
jgi:ribosomal protein S25